MAPTDPWVEFWNKSNNAWLVAFESWKKSLPASATADPSAWQRTWAESMGPIWQQAFGPWQEMQRQAMRIFTGQAPLPGVADPSAAFRAPPPAADLSALVNANFEAALKALTEVSAAMVKRLEAIEPGAVQRVWKALSDEYLKDLDGLPHKMNAGSRTEELARFAGELAAGNPSADARKYLERFIESLRVKTARGWEYYAEPTTTPVGPTPRTIALDRGALTLYRYGATPHVPGRPPLVMVYSIINKAYILDLVAGTSVIERLLQQGVDVWLVEWKEGKPGSTDTLDEYIDPLLKDAVETVKKSTGFEQVGLFGWCVGGTMALLYAACFPDDISALITLTTPITSTGSGVLELWLDPVVFPLDEILATHRHMPGRVVRQSLIAIKPYLEILKWKGFYENLHDDAVMSLFLPVDRWANDNPDVAGEVFRKFVIDIYREDRLMKGISTIHGRPVDLKRVTCPVLNLIAKKDWIVPPEAAAKVIDAVGSLEKTNEFVPGPHTGLILDPRARATWDRMARFTIEKAWNPAASEAPVPPVAPETAPETAPQPAPDATPETAPPSARAKTRKPRKPSPKKTAT